LPMMWRQTVPSKDKSWSIEDISLILVYLLVLQSRQTAADRCDANMKERTWAPKRCKGTWKSVPKHQD
jgi:hypothetical protein